MTLFEYLSVGVSIVLSLSAAQLLINIRAVLHPAERYWVHALWVIHLLVIHVMFWWNFWAYREVESWNLAFFALALASPGLLFVCSNALVLAQRSNKMSWEEHFFSVRKSFFVMRGVIALIAQLRRWLLLGLPILEPRGLPALVMIAVCVIGFFSTSRRVHAALVLVGLADIVFGIGYFRFQSGALTLGPSQ